MSAKTKNRDLGLDLLRIISMLMVITIHYLGNGGLIDRALRLLQSIGSSEHGLTPPASSA